MLDLQMTRGQCIFPDFEFGGVTKVWGVII